jgi:hypothetical protein
MLDTHGNMGGPMGGGFLRQPGDYRTTTVTPVMESTLPVRQAAIMGVAIFISQLALLAIFAVLTAAFGWWMVLALIEVAWLGVCVFWAFKSGEAGLPTLVFLLVGAALPFIASPIIPLAYAYPDKAALVVVAVVLIYFLPAVLVPSGFLSWRMAAEVSDPSYSAPRVAIERMMPTFPWTKEGESHGYAGDPDTIEEREQLTDMFQAVLDKKDSPRQRDLLIVRNNGQHELVSGEMPADAFEVEPQAINLIETDKGVAAYTGSKPKVLVEDLRRYVAMYSEVGLSFRKSKVVIGWGEETWRSAVLTLRAMGVLEPGSNGTEPKMAMGGRDALALVDAKLVIPKENEGEQ